MSNIPKMLDFPEVKPRGINTEFKTMRFTPLTSFNSYVTNDIVRFWMPMINGYLDPYETYIELEVEVDPTEFPYGHALQVDNSASSFISEMTIFSDGKEIERIQEYDTIAALLNDVMYQPGDEFGKEYEGSGYASHDSMGFVRNNRRSTNVGSAHNFSTEMGTTIGRSANLQVIEQLPIYTSGYNPSYPQYVDLKQAEVGYTTEIGVVTGDYNVPLETANYANYNTGGAANTVAEAKIPGVVTQADSAATSNNTADARTHPAGLRAYPTQGSLDSFPLSYNGTANTFTDLNLLAPRPFVEAFCESSLYGIQSTNAFNFSLFNDTAYVDFPYPTNPTRTEVITPNYNYTTVRNNGYTQAFSEELSNSSDEALISPLAPISWIQNGKFKSAPITSEKRIFQIPIISALMGVLIPAESYELIPMQALKNLMLEFRLNEFAMFTSGYLENFTNPAIDRVSIPMSTQLKREWKINRFEIFGAIYSFDDFVDSMMRQRLSAGIPFASNGWALGPRFSVPNTMAVENSWQINAGYESVETVAFRIQCDDYERYSFCRKHYYLSGNITSLQLEIANTYIPPQPIIGHGGNVVPKGNVRNNAPFIIELHKTFGELFNIGSNMYINSTNFAVNDRPYDPTNTAAFWTAGGTNGTITNIDTASGLPLFHENRCVGRAMYAFDLEALPGDEGVISGLNTLKYRPFEVQIDVDGNDQFTRDATLMFFLNYDVIFVLKADAPPEVYGRG